MTGFLPGTRTQEHRREIYALLGKVEAFGGRVKLAEIMNPALGGIFRHYIEADMCMLAGDSEGDNLGLAKTRHELLLLRRQLIEAANAQYRKNLREMVDEYGNEAVRCHLNMPECNKAMSEVDAFVNGTKEDDPVKLYEAMSNAGAMESKVAGILRMVQKVGGFSHGH